MQLDVLFVDILAHLFVFPPGEHKSEQTEPAHPNNNGPVNPTDFKNTGNTAAEHGEQDADDEAAEDTDDTRSENDFFIGSLDPVNDWETLEPDFEILCEFNMIQY